jgi:hypothetical protein
MDYILIKESDVNFCSEKSIVAVWNDEHNCPMVVKNAYTLSFFEDNDVVTIEVTEEDEL